MNEAFRQYVFGRSFHISLSDKHIDLLARLCTGDEVASHGFDGQRHGLIRRGLIEVYFDGRHSRIRPTKAGVLIYQLLVEAGEYQALEEKRQKTLDMEAELSAREWDERFGKVEIKLKDAYRRGVTTQ